MLETQRTGRTILRAVDGRKAAGVCTYNLSKSGLEAGVSAHLFSGGRASAVLQFGPERGYLCRPAADAAEPLRCGEPGVMAVWVLDDGEPALFGQLVSGAFDREEAKRRLPGGSLAKQAETDTATVKAAAIPATAPRPTPSPREPSPEETEVPFHVLARQAGAESPLLLLQPGIAEETPVPHTAAAEHAPAAGGRPRQAETVTRQPAPPNAGEAKKPAQPWSPLIVKRAPRPAPRPPVYSPLWDDVSAELANMLDTLPRVQPFNGGSVEAEFAEVPTGGAVQCYVGSVVVNGMKVFMQAVPARPYARPAGFDHSLVSRSGECFWVKYFIEDN